MVTDKIYISSNDPSLERGFVTGCIEKMKSDDVEFIRKNAMMEWLEEMSATYAEPEISETYLTVIDKLNSM